MKKHEKKTVNVNPLSNQELIDSYDYLATAASSHDCTGLIPSAPLNPAELDSYEELYPFLPPVSSADDAPEQAPPSGKNPSENTLQNTCFFLTCLPITANLIEV